MFDMRPYRRRNNRISNYNPFYEMEEFEKNFFKNPFGMLNDRFFEDNDLAEFKTDITDEGDAYVLEADLPGFKKEDIQLELNGSTLTVRAERHSEYEQNEKKDHYVRCERSYGAYSREFDVSGVEKDKIKAKYKDGVLRLTLPKKAGEDPNIRHLEIE